MTRVRLTQLEVPDYDLGIRGKLLRSDKLNKLGRTAFCTIVYGLDPEDGVTDTPLATAVNGYPDAFAVPDESTRVDLYWRDGTDAVLADLVDADGVPLEESPRATLARVVGCYDALGLQPILGYEYECHVLHADDDLLRSRAYSRMRPLGRVDNAYSIGRLAESGEIFGEFVDRMDSIGITVDACHSELGPGFFEFALGPMPAMESADSAVRSRQYFRDLCAERGLVATFMAKVNVDTSGAGGHVHQSLQKNGQNVLGDGQGGLSETGRHYLGGLVATMGDATVLFNPFLNSYKRISAGFFVAETSSWGWDDRNTACRIITNAGVSAARIEHRRPGADANPYLAAAGMLAGGLHGLDKHLDPGRALPGGAPQEVGSPLPDSLELATTRFRESKALIDLLGERFVNSYASTREGEIQAFRKWWSSTITDWEKIRYLEHL